MSVYGWRAAAVPLLVILTVLAVVDASRSSRNPTPAAAPPPPSPTSAATTSAQPAPSPAAPSPVGAAPLAAGSFDAAVPASALPPGGGFPVTGAGTWHVVAGSGPRVGAPTAALSTYTIEVEDGMDTAPFGGDSAFAALVQATLTDPRSWTGDGRFALQRIDTGTPTFRISLSAQLTVRSTAECGYQIPVETSCYSASTARVVLNAARWVRGGTAFQGDIGSYRQYLVNHEVGHALGFAAHQPCPSQAALAPIMMQQSFGVANNDLAALDPGGAVPADGVSCRYNPWPFPRG
jgi:hypothetical protein